MNIKEAVESVKSKSLTILDSLLPTGFSNNYDTTLAEAGSAIRGSPKTRHYTICFQRLYKRFIRKKDLILRFMTDFRVPYDNNGSERDLRMLKLQQKISVCFPSIEGVEVFWRIRSARKQRRGLLSAIESAKKNKPIAYSV